MKEKILDVLVQTGWDKKLNDIQQISDDYAIEFAEWCLVNNVYKSETFEDDNLFLCGIKKYDDGTDRIYYMDELLKEFKKGL